MHLILFASYYFFILEDYLRLTNARGGFYLKNQSLLLTDIKKKTFCSFTCWHILVI